MKTLFAAVISLGALLVATPAQAREHGCASTSRTSGVMASGRTSCAFAQRVALAAARRPEVRSTRSFKISVLSPVTGRRYTLACQRAAGTDEVMCEDQPHGVWAWFDVSR